MININMTDLRAHIPLAQQSCSSKVETLIWINLYRFTVLGIKTTKVNYFQELNCILTYFK